MGGVSLDDDIVDLEIVDVVDGACDAKPRQRSGGAGELQAGLVDVVEIEVDIAEGDDEFARPKPDDVRKQVGEQGVARDVEREPEEGIGAALVHLAGEAIRVDVELEHDVTGLKGHEFELAGIPGAHQVAA